MNTFVKESKQGASTTADLQKQKPHEEIIESKPSTASSDEEKLAAGISTIGLQAKRLSGAQMKSSLETERSPRRSRRWPSPLTLTLLKPLLNHTLRP